MKYEVVIDFETMDIATAYTTQDAYKIAINFLDEHELSHISKSEMLEIGQFLCQGGDLVIDGVEIREVWA